MLAEDRELGGAKLTIGHEFVIYQNHVISRAEKSYSIWAIRCQLYRIGALSAPLHGFSALQAGVRIYLGAFGEPLGRKHPLRREYKKGAGGPPDRPLDQYPDGSGLGNSQDNSLNQRPNAPDSRSH